MDSDTRKELLLRLISSAEKTAQNYRIERYFLIAISFLGALVLIAGSGLLIWYDNDAVLDLITIGGGAGITSGASYMLSKRIDQHFELVGSIASRLLSNGDQND